MKKTVLVCSAMLMASFVVVQAIGTIKEVKLEDGRDDTNRIAAPVFDAQQGQPLQFAIQPAYDRKAKIVRRGATNMFTRGPEYNLDKAVDLGALLTQALRTEAASMGFRVADSGDAGWRIDGEIRDVYLESKQIPYGATLFYGYMDLAIAVRSGTSTGESQRMRLHNYFGAYNAGLGRKDEATEALAHLIVEGAQEAVSRLNRGFFKAPVHPDVAALLARLPAGGAYTPNELHRAGLSGSGEAAMGLLDLLPKEPNENRRSALIDALARLASPDAVAPLATRYSTEDEDCRWYTLKAMDYIGGDEAIALVRTQGLKDKDGGPRRLAQRIAGSS